MEWATLPLKRYSQFSGRSRRKEFWSFVLLCIGVSIVANTIDGILGMSGLIGGFYGPVTLLAALALVIPQWAVGIRRLHDTGRSGWWMLLLIVPGVATLLIFASGLWMLSLLNLVVLVLLYFFVLDGTRGANQYGADPKEDEVPAPSTI